MTLTRYEFEGRGIFHALNILYNMPNLADEDKQDLEWAEQEFQKGLEKPSVLFENMVQGEADKDWYSFFTPKGEQAFASCLDVVLNLFYQAEESGIGELKTITMELPKDRIVYQDEYQVVLDMPGNMLKSV